MLTMAPMSWLHMLRLVRPVAASSFSLMVCINRPRLNTEQTVEAAVKAAGADVTSFQRLAVGEGVEKVVEDYAAEVAKAMQV